MSADPSCPFPSTPEGRMAGDSALAGVAMGDAESLIIKSSY